MVPGDVQPEVAVGGRGGQTERAGLQPLRERFPGAGVEGRPLGAVRRAGEGPVGGVAFGCVVRRGEGVGADGRGFVEVELDPSGGGEGQPLGARLAVEEVLLHLAAGAVLGARPDARDPVGHVAGEPAAVSAVHPRGAAAAVRRGVDGASPVGGGFSRLEGRGELPAGERDGAGSAVAVPCAPTAMTTAAVTTAVRNRLNRCMRERPPASGQRPGQRCPPAAQESVGGQVDSDVKDVGYVERRSYRAIFRQGAHRSFIFP